MTRRNKFLQRKTRYTQKAGRARTWKWVWGRTPAGKAIRLGVKPNYVEGPKQEPAEVSSASYSASPIVLPGVPIFYTVSNAGNGSPPHVKITNGWYLLFRADGQHQPWPFLRWHAKRVKARRRLSNVKRTKLERQITGCNWRYFRNDGYFPDDDVLGRHPNETDRINGVPQGPLPFPVPLGY